MDKEFYKRLNGIQYSNDEIDEYIKLSGMTDEEAANISGAVRTKYGQRQIKYNAQKLSDILEEDEEVIRIIKFRDIRAIGTITICSMMGATTFKSDDFAIFKIICFTNKRLLFTDTNVLNKALTIGWVNNDEILGTKFTTQKVEFDEKEPLNIRFTRWTKGVVASETALAVSLLVSLFNHYLIAFLPITILFFLVIKFQQKYLDRYVIIMSGKRVFSLLIATYNYKEDRAFLAGSSKYIKD